MTKKKTPLMILIGELEQERLAFLKMNVPCNHFDTAIEKAKSLLPTEREGLEDAYREGHSNTFINLNNDEKELEETPDQWFNETYETN